MPNVNELATRLGDPWRPIVVDEANGFQLKVVKLHGEFPWHVHEQEDELFLCHQGRFRIELADGAPVTLSAGDTYVVPAGQRHRPVAPEPAVALLLEKAETKQYGD